jgi:hypothetical protein
MRPTNVLVAALLAITLAACGEDSSSGGQGGTRVTALGGSITAGSPLWDPDPGRPGLMRKGYVSDDQIHPTVAGYPQLGEVVELP